MKRCKEHDYERTESDFRDNKIFHSWTCTNCSKYIEDYCDECTHDYLLEKIKEEEEE